MIEYFGFSILGIGMGTFTGLIPGVHVNNITPLLVGLVAGSTLSTHQAISLIVAMMLTHTFIDFIPATFLGVPNKDTALSVLPAHKMVLKGQGYTAIKLTALGSLGALLFSVILIGPLTPLIGPVYRSINPEMHWLLLSVVIIMILLETTWTKRLAALGVFTLSGLLGFIVLNSNLIGGDESLMPLLGGLFGMSILLVSLNNENTMPVQSVNEEPISIIPNAKPIVTGASAGFLTGVLPGIGPAQGTVLTQAATNSESPKNFLVGVSGVNTAKALLSFVALYAIGRPRSGAAVAVNEIIEVGLYELIFLIGIALFVGGIAAMIHLKLGKIAARKIRYIPYRGMCLGVMASIVGFSFYYANLWGIIILGVATSIGIIPAALNIKRTHCMGALLFPIILYFSGLEELLMNILGL